MLESDLLKIYQVKSSFHETDESGYYSTGIFSTKEKAWKSAKKLAEWIEEKPINEIKNIELDEKDGSIKIRGWDSTFIYVYEIEVDKEAKDLQDATYTGYT